MKKCGCAKLFNRTSGRGSTGRDRRRFCRSEAANTGAVRETAGALHIDLMPLSDYSPDFMPVEALWHWLREDVTDHRCHPTADDLSCRVTAFETRPNQDTCAVAGRLWVED